MLSNSNSLIRFLPLPFSSQEYIEPDEAALQSGNLPKRSGLLSPAGGPGGEEDESVLLPLGETTLTDNLGLPIVVVVTKTDAIGMEIGKGNA